MLNDKCHSNSYPTTYVMIGFTIHESEGGHLTSQHCSCSSIYRPRRDGRLSEPQTSGCNRGLNPYHLGCESRALTTTPKSPTLPPATAGLSQLQRTNLPNRLGEPRQVRLTVCAQPLLYGSLMITTHNLHVRSAGN